MKSAQLVTTTMRSLPRRATFLLLALASQAQALVLQQPLLRPMRAVPMARAPLFMQEGDSGNFGQSGERERGRTAVIAKPKPKPKEKNKEDVEKEGSWRVLLHNDDVRRPRAHPCPRRPSPGGACCRSTPSTTSTWRSCEWCARALHVPSRLPAPQAASPPSLAARSSPQVQTITRKKAHRITAHAVRLDLSLIHI